MTKNITSTIFKTPLLNDCTNHLAFQLEHYRKTTDEQKKCVNSSHETLLTDIVTDEFIRGYN